MGTGVTQSNNELRFFLEDEALDPFMDSFNQEMFVLHAIIDKTRYMNGKPVTVTLNKELLMRMVKSHIKNIKEILGEKE